jgi:hypothetical protein
VLRGGTYSAGCATVKFAVSDVASGVLYTSSTSVTMTVPVSRTAASVERAAIGQAGDSGRGDRDHD